MSDKAIQHSANVFKESVRDIFRLKEELRKAENKCRLCQKDYFRALVRRGWAEYPPEKRKSGWRPEVKRLEGVVVDTENEWGAWGVYVLIQDTFLIHILSNNLKYLPGAPRSQKKVSEMIGKRVWVNALLRESDIRWRFLHDGNVVESEEVEHESHHEYEDGSSSNYWTTQHFPEGARFLPTFISYRPECGLVK